MSKAKKTTKPDERPMGLRPWSKAEIKALSLSMSKDDARVNLRCIKLTEFGAYATDGHQLAMCGDVDRMLADCTDQALAQIGADTVRRLLRCMSASDLVEMDHEKMRATLTDRHGGFISEWRLEPGRPNPAPIDLQKVVPEWRDDGPSTHEIGIDAEKIERLLRSLKIGANIGKGGTWAPVRVQVPEGALDPIRIDAQRDAPDRSWCAVLMPVRM